MNVATLITNLLIGAEFVLFLFILVAMLLIKAQDAGVVTKDYANRFVISQSVFYSRGEYRFISLPVVVFVVVALEKIFSFGVYGISGRVNNSLLGINLMALVSMVVVFALAKFVYNNQEGEFHVSFPWWTLYKTIGVILAVTGIILTYTTHFK